MLKNKICWEAVLHDHLSLNNLRFCIYNFSRGKLSKNQLPKNPQKIPVIFNWRFQINYETNVWQSSQLVKCSHEDW